MAIADTPRVEPYGFPKQFEEQILYLLCSDEDFYRRIGFLLEPEAFENSLAQEIARTVHLMVDESIMAKKRNKETPVNIFDRRKSKVNLTPLYVIQRLNQVSREHGKIPSTTVNEALDYVEILTDKLDLEIDEEAVISLLVPEIKRRLQNKAITTSIDTYRDKKKAFKAVIELLEEAETLGEPTMQIGAGTLSFSDVDTYKAIEALQNRSRIPTGIAELDRDFAGGIPESSLLCIMGSPGGGKSQFLNHVAMESVLAGEFTLYATLEVEPEIVMARSLANLSGIPIDDLFGDRLLRAQSMMAELAPWLGDFEVEMFEAEVTKVQHIKDWVHRKEDEYGKKCKQVIIDYADYLGAGDPNMPTYQAMKHIYRGLYSWSHKEKTRIYTASATKEKKDKRGTTGLDDASDSRYKARIVDIMLAIDRTPEGVFISVPKNRAGKSQGVHGPLQEDYATGRVVRVARGNLMEYIERSKEKVSSLAEFRKQTNMRPIEVTQGW